MPRRVREPKSRTENALVAGPYQTPYWSRLRPREIHLAAVARHDLLGPRLQGPEKIPDRGRATAALPKHLAAVERHDPLSRKDLKKHPAAVAPRPA